MSAHPFEFNTQVWTRYDDDWWPAKVVDPSLFGFPDTSSLLIQFYSEGAEVAQFDYNPELVVPFELSSQKAVSGNPEIQAAIQRAQEDTTAVPATAVAAAAPSQKRQKQQTSTTAAAAAGTRRGRGAAAATEMTQPSNSAYDTSVDARLNDTQLMELCDELRRAAGGANNNETELATAPVDVASVRRILLRLARVKPTFRQLQATSIGLAVGGISQDPRLSSLQAISACILRTWMQELPESTKDALRRYAARATGVGLSVLYGESGNEEGAAGVERTAAGVVVENAANEDAAATSAAVAAAGAVSSGASSGIPAGLGKFGSRLASVFLRFDCLDKNTSDAIANFCKQAENTIKNPDQRVKLLDEVNKESHKDLRAKLLTGELPIAKFMTMSKEELVSPEEISVRAELAEAIAWRAAEGKNELVGNTLYECPKCKARNSVQKEVQIRSADEPATVFITCLDCKHNWSEN